VEFLAIRTVTAAAVAGVISLAVALGAPARPAPEAVATLAASAPEAGLIAIAGPVPGTIRVLYARNGGMVLLREISVPPGGDVRELALSADGKDLFVATEASRYALSTRTGRVEAQAVAADTSRYAAIHPAARG
jgi:hypothetical protein